MKAHSIIRGMLFICMMLMVSTIISGCSAENLITRIADLGISIFNTVKGACGSSGCGQPSQTSCGAASTQTENSPTAANEKGSSGAVSSKPVPNVDGEVCRVVVYGMAGCGACQRAKSFLQGRNIPFEYKDVQSDSGALAEMQDKAKNNTAVPVIDICGTVVIGFDQSSIESALNNKGIR